MLSKPPNEGILPWKEPRLASWLELLEITVTFLFVVVAMFLVSVGVVRAFVLAVEAVGLGYFLLHVFRNNSRR